MSRLVLDGNVNENLGLNFPVPYIERIYLDPSDITAGYYGYKITTRVYVPNPPRDASGTNDFQSLLNESLTLSVVIASDMTEEQFANIVNGKTFLWEDFINNEEGSASATWKWPRRAYDNPLSSLSRTIVYDQDGNEYVAYEHNVKLTFSKEIWGSSGLDSLYVFAVTGLDGAPASQSAYTTSIANPELYKRQFSEVTYEKIWVNGDIADRLQQEYFDSNDNIYNNTPLRTIDSLYVEDNVLTHVEVVEYFQELIEEFQADYERYPRLAKMMDSVSLVLETYGEDTNLVPELNKLRKVFPTKSPSNPTGKFYKRFRKRIVTVNDKLKQASRLSRRIVRNGKIIDTRNTPDLDYDAPSTWLTHGWDDSDLLYNDWYVSRIADTSTNIITHQGVFFFDYEKALRLTSNIANVLEVTKLIDLGIEIPYGMYQIEAIYLARKASSIEIVSHMDLDRAYPKTDWCEITDTFAGYLEKEGFGADVNKINSVCPWYDNPAVIVRSFYNLDTSPSYGEREYFVENYRLLACTFQDYYENGFLDDVDTTEEAGLYTATVRIADNTINVIKALAKKYYTAYMDFRSYYNNASALGSLNEDTQTFNTFFKDGIVAAYEDNMESAPWIVAPLAYCFHLDLVYDTYGGSKEEILNAAYAFIDQVNPVNGTYDAIAKFANLMGEFYQDIYVYNTDTSLLYLALSFQPDLLSAYEADSEADLKSTIEFSNTYDYSTLSISNLPLYECNSDDDCDMVSPECKEGESIPKCAADNTCECEEIQTTDTGDEVDETAPTDASEEPERTESEDAPDEEDDGTSSAGKDEKDLYSDYGRSYKP